MPSHPSIKGTTGASGEDEAAEAPINALLIGGQLAAIFEYRHKRSKKCQAAERIDVKSSAAPPKRVAGVLVPSTCPIN
jgi:hypothetical protein